MGKRKNEQPAAGGEGEFHVPKTKRSPGDGLDATGDADGKASPAAGRTDDCGQTTGGTATPSANGEAAAPGAAWPELPQRVNSVDEEEEDSADEEGENVPGQHGSAGDAEMQTHHGTGNIGDGPERPREAAGAVMALYGDTGIIVPVEAPGAHHEEEGERGECGAADQNQKCGVNARETECGAASERAAGGETRENGTKQPQVTRTSDAERCGSPERLGVCAPAMDAEGGTAGAESTGKTPGEAAVGREETGGGETPSPGAGLALDPAVVAGGSPIGDRDGEAASMSAAGTDMQPPVCCEGAAETAPAVMVTPAPPGTAEPPSVGIGTAEPPGSAEPSGTGTGTAEPPGVGTSTTEPPGTAEPSGTGTGTAEPPGVGTSTTEPPGTAEPSGTGTGTAEPPGVGTSTTEAPGTAEPSGTGTGTTEPPSMGSGTAEPPSTAEPSGTGTGTAEPPDVGSGTAEPPSTGTGTTEPPSVGTGTAEPPGTTEPPSVGSGTAEPPSTGTGTAEPPGVGTSTAEPPGTTEPPGVGTGTTEPLGVGTGTAEPPSAGTGVAVGAETPIESRVAMEPPPPWLELPPQQPPPATDQRDPAETAPPGRSHNQEPPHREDATDVVCGLILELSNLNRLAMSAYRGLETLRRPKPRQSRRPVPPRAGRWRKET